MNLRLIIFVFLQFGLINHAFALDWASVTGKGFEGEIALDIDGISDVTIDSVSFFADLDFPDCFIVCNNGTIRKEISSEWQNVNGKIYFRTRDFSHWAYAIVNPFGDCAIRMQIKGHDSQGRSFSNVLSGLLVSSEDRKVCRSGITPPKPLALTLKGGLTSGYILVELEQNNPSSFDQ